MFAFKNTNHTHADCTVKQSAFLVLSLLSSILVFSFCSISSASAATSTLNLTLSDSNVTMNIAPTSANGSFSKSSTSTISASTNNATGYTLSIAASSSNTNASKLINTSDSTSALNSITSATTEEQFKALSATTYNNMWGYLPSKYCSDGTSTTCTTNTSFLPAPSISGDILDQTSTANTTANNYTIAIGARIDSTTKTGTYQNTYVVKLVANAIPYSIIYDDNVVSNMPTDISSTTTGTSVTIDNKTPVRAGYRFLGWCSGTVTTTDGIDSCSGTTYQPSATLSINQTGTGNSFNLVAMWGLVTQSSCYTSPMISTVASGITYMQDINSTNSSAVLSALTTDATYQIKDNRDNETYCVGKLQDGKLWLLDNLALDLTNSTILNGMDQTNTNATNTTLGYLKGTTTRDPSTDPDGEYAIAGVANWTSGSSYSAPMVNTASKDMTNSNDSLSSDAKTWKYGVYYNYCAASAGGYCYGNGQSGGTSSGNATEDICPSRWRMPTMSDNGEYRNLMDNYYTTAPAMRTALHISLAGDYRGYNSGQGDFAELWSSTRAFGTSMLIFRTNLSSMTKPNYERKYGFSVRCVLES